MANEITYTGQGGDLRASEILNAAIWDLIYDRTDLRQICLKVADLGGSGSSTSKTAQVDFGNAMGAANADETTAAGNTTLSSGNLSLSVAQQIIAYEISDLLSVTGGPGNLGMADLARAVAESYVLRFTQMACEAGDGFSSTVGTTTVDLTMDDIYSAIFTLEQAVVPGPYNCVLSPTQFTDLQESLRSEGGALQFHAPTAEMLAAKGPGFKGSFLGVDFWASNQVQDANGGADSAGWMQGAGAIAYVEASAAGAMAGSVAAPSMSPVYAEFDRVADPGLSRIVAHAFVGVGIGEDARGVSIITDK